MLYTITREGFPFSLGTFLWVSDESLVPVVARKQSVNNDAMLVTKAFSQDLSFVLLLTLYRGLSVTPFRKESNVFTSTT